MKSKLAILRITRAKLLPQQRSTFRYTLDANTKRIAGVLCSNGTQLSLSFLNGFDVEINSLETLVTDTLELPPNKRILTWDQDLTDSRIITGNIINIQPYTQWVSLYILTYRNTADEK